MKTLMILALAAAITTSSAARDRYFSDAQRHRSVNLAQVSQRYLESLRSENEGVVRSALAHVTWMKLMVPEQSFGPLQAEITSLASSGSSPEIRYMASLAGLVFSRPSMFAGVEKKDFESGDDMFASVAQRVSFSLLEKGSN